MKRSVLLLSVMSLAILTAEKEVRAEWQYSSSECVYEAWDESPNAHYVADGTLQVYSTASSAYYFYCPMSDDSTSNFTDEKNAIWVVDNHVDSGTPLWYEQVNCSLYSCSTTFTSCNYDSEATTGNSSSKKCLDFDAVNYLGASFIICSIPNFHDPSWSGIIQYHTRSSYASNECAAH